MDGRCEVVDAQMGRCMLDADGHVFPGVHAYEKVPGPPGPPQKWQVQQRSEPELSEVERLREQVRELARQARQGEMLRRHIRSLVGDWPTVETYRLRHALGDECHECCGFCHYHGCRCGDE